MNMIRKKGESSKYNIVNAFEMFSIKGSSYVCVEIHP